MYELDECLQLARLINDKEEQIFELDCLAKSPRNQTLSLTPKGSGEHSSPSEVYLIKKERIEKAVKKLRQKRENLWNKVLTILQYNNIDNVEYIDMLKARFYKGMSWKECVKYLNNTYKDSIWGTNKCFRVYRKILFKIDKKTG